jgi:perosamine synthetase
VILNQFFCLDPQTIESKISSATKAILTTDIHGQSSDMAEILRIARKHNLFVINDCAQAPGARYRGEHVGGIGDVGIFSLIGYLKPSYLEPPYQKRNAIGDHGYPFNETFLG